MPSLHEMRPGAQPHEQVGKLADGRQVLLTTRFGPVMREDGAHTQLTLVVFDPDGAVLSSDSLVLGLTTELSERRVAEVAARMLTPLGAFTSSAITIQPVPVALLGEQPPPLILRSEDDPELSLTLTSDEAFFIPDWPFGDAG